MSSVMVSAYLQFFSLGLVTGIMIVGLLHKWGKKYALAHAAILTLQIASIIWYQNAIN